MVLLPNAQALIAGGYDANYTKDFRSAELYDPVTGSWSRTGTMNKERVADDESAVDRLVLGRWAR